MALPTPREVARLFATPTDHIVLPTHLARVSMRCKTVCWLGQSIYGSMVPFTSFPFSACLGRLHRSLLSRVDIIMSVSDAPHRRLACTRAAIPHSGLSR